MRGPFWDDEETGVTGEPLFARDKTENYEHYTGDDGKTHTRILATAK